MPLVVKDRVRETSTTAGTGTFTLAGAVLGYQSFSAIGDGNTTYYTIYLQGGNEWEVGIGTYTASGTTLSRDTILASSNAGSAVNFSAGVKDVFVTYPAGRSVWYDSATNVTLNALTLSGGTQNGVLYLNASRVATSGSALTFDGTKLGINGGVISDNNLVAQINTPASSAKFMAFNRSGDYGLIIGYEQSAGDYASIRTVFDYPIVFSVNNAEQMRLTSTGLALRQAGIPANTSVSLNTTIQNALTLEADGDLLVGTTTNTNSSKLVASGTISETVSSTQYLVASQFDIGTAANEIPLNQYLGNLAYQDAGSIAGQVGLSAGTAALPSLVSATDTDTGMWFPAANTLAWSTGGTQVVTVDSSGRLLIGPTSATAGGGLLQIGQVPNSTSSSIGFNNNDNAVISARYSMVFQNDSDNNIGGREFSWKKGGKGYSDGTTLMVLDASGFFVVGDTTTGSSRFTSASTSYPETTEYAGVFKAGTVSPLSNRYLLLRQTYTGGAFDSLPLVWEANADGANQKSYGVIQTIADGSIVFSNKAAGAAVAIGTALGVAERARFTSGGTFQTSLDASIYGVTVGRGAGAVSTNTAVGAGALGSHTSGAFNVAVGANAAPNATSFANATVVGMNAIGTGVATGTYITAIGTSALQKLTSGSYVTGVGVLALKENTTGSYNTALGVEALQANTTGVATFGTVTGGSGYTNGTYNGVQLTYSSGTAASTYPTANIVVSGGAVTTVTLVSAGTGFKDTTTVLTAPAASIGGTGSGFTVPVATLAAANYNTAVGYQSGYSQTTGGNNTSFGATSLYTTTTGTLNTAIGQSSLYFNTTGSNNTALGLQALFFNATASYNTAVGYQAGYTNTTAQYSVYVGVEAGYTSNAERNTIVGAYAGQLVTGANNTLIGQDAGALLTIGAKNTILGRYNGNQGNLNIIAASNYIVLSDGDGNPRGYFDGTRFAVKSTANDTNTSLMIKKTTGVSTTATDISAAYGDFGQLCIVSGLETGTGNFFTDLVFTCTTGGPTVISSKSVSGSPAGRTYTFPSNFLKLAMASGTYDIHCASWNGL